jgi:hypothetical protein
MIKQFYAPTPVKWRKIGDALLGVSTMITGLSIAEDYKWVAIVSLALGVIGKFLTNLFTEDE